MYNDKLWYYIHIYRVLPASWATFKFSKPLHNHAIWHSNIIIQFINEFLKFYIFSPFTLWSESETVFSVQISEACILLHCSYTLSVQTRYTKVPTSSVMHVFHSDSYRLAKKCFKNLLSSGEITSGLHTTDSKVK